MLYYNRHRSYDPSTGRYLQPEPLFQDPEAVQAYARAGYPLQVYGYALNNPLRFVDLDGLRPLTVKEWFQAGFYANAIFLSWLTGWGPREFNFGPDSPATKILTASNAFEEAKRYHELNKFCDGDYKPYGRNASSWREFFGNPLWAVTGKFSIDFSESGDVTLYNNTSLTSALSPAFNLPDYEGHWPGSNVKQKYEAKP